jgi:hypothetical protein
MNKTLMKVVVIIVLLATTFYVYANYMTACTEPLAYSVGDVDPRFGVTQAEFLEQAEWAEGVWEAAFGREFFRYDPQADFKISLVFDDRQQRTIDERNSREDISTQQQSYRAKVNSYEARLNSYKEENSAYDAAIVAYDRRLEAYNAQVDHWNRNGGAPAKEYAQLQQEKSALQREATRLEGVRQALNREAAQLNNEGAEINTMAQELNLNVDAYNGKFGTTREFDQGSYTGSAINIYQFNTQEDLRLVLAHEYGHALGLEHVDDPEAVMYYLMDKQNLRNLSLTETDKQALKRECHVSYLP